MLTKILYCTAPPCLVQTSAYGAEWLPALNLAASTVVVELLAGGEAEASAEVGDEVVLCAPCAQGQVDRISIRKYDNPGIRRWE